jgi:hypothetical protein
MSRVRGFNGSLVSAVTSLNSDKETGHDKGKTAPSHQTAALPQTGQPSNGTGAGGGGGAHLPDTLKDADSGNGTLEGSELARTLECTMQPLVYPRWAATAIILLDESTGSCKALVAGGYKGVCETLDPVDDGHSNTKVHLSSVAHQISGSIHLNKASKGKEAPNSIGGGKGYVNVSGQGIMDLISPGGSAAVSPAGNGGSGGSGAGARYVVSLSCCFLSVVALSLPFRIELTAIAPSFPNEL